MERMIQSGGAKIWTDRRGNCEKGFVLLCSGGPGSCDYLQPISEMMEDGYCVIRFEQRGCGRSDGDGKYGIATALEDMEAIRRAYGIDRWIVGGHSWGANLALMYALEYPQTVRSVLYLAGNGLQRDREWSEQYHENKEKFGEEMPWLPYRANEEVNRVGNAEYREYIRKPTLWRDLAQLEMPILFLCAQNDIRPNWPAMQLSHLVKKGTLSVIDGAEHYLWLKQRSAVEKSLREFLGLASRVQ